MLKPCYARLTLVLMLALYVLRGPRDCGLSGDWVDADPPPTGVRTAVDPPVFAPFDGQICRQFTAKHRLDRRPATTPMLAYSPESFASSGPPFTLRINPMSLDYHATREAVAEYLDGQGRDEHGCGRVESARPSIFADERRRLEVARRHHEGAQVARLEASGSHDVAPATRWPAVARATATHLKDHDMQDILALVRELPTRDEWHAGLSSVHATIREAIASRGPKRPRAIAQASRRGSWHRRPDADERRSLPAATRAHATVARQVLGFSYYEMDVARWRRLAGNRHRACRE